MRSLLVLSACCCVVVLGCSSGPATTASDQPSETSKNEPIVPLDTLRMDLLKKVHEVVVKVAAKSNKRPWQMKNEELADDKGIAGLVPDKVVRGTYVGAAMTFDPEEPVAMPDLSGYRPLAEDSNDPVMKYTIAPGPFNMTDPVDLGEVVRKKKANIFKVRIKQPNMEAMAVWAGPMSRDMVDQMLKSITGGTTADVSDEIPVTFYSNGRSLLVVLDPVEKFEQVNGNFTLTYYREPLDVVKAALKGSSTHPPAVIAKFAVLKQ